MLGDTGLPRIVKGVRRGDDARARRRGGIRRGVDVLRALALGARRADRAAGDRGLALDGADGVTRVLDDLATELRRALAARGVASVTAVDRGLLAPRG